MISIAYVIFRMPFTGLAKHGPKIGNHSAVPIFCGRTVDCRRLFRGVHEHATYLSSPSR